MNPCTNGLINCNDIIGQVILGLTSQTTGSLFITSLFIVIILLAIALMMGLRLEYTSIIILPFLLGLMVISKDFIALGAVILIYLAFILTGNFILK
jgi:hypothetical protein